MKRQGFGARIRALFSRGLASEEALEELEDLLIESDLGARTSMDIVDALRERSRAEKASTQDELVYLLAALLRERIKSIAISLDPDRLNVILLLGVNGVGKTTTLAKLATHFMKSGQANGVVMAAGDTFRAAAVEQLAIHAERIGARLISQGKGADAGAVIFDAVESARKRGDQLVLADTAGRMHTKKHLVEELSKIDRIVAGRAPDAAYKRLLVIDATTGQNGLRQAEIFSEAVEITGIILAKYDSTAKGGILVPISEALGIPTAFVGTGESYEQLSPFDPDRYVQELVGLE